MSNSVETRTLSFDAVDTLFFRESRPMESQGELRSVFPPPVRTLAGALRTLIGERSGVAWHEFNENHPLSEIIGFGDNLGPLSFKGAWLSRSGERLYPAPLHLLKNDTKLFQLELAKEGTWCDLGRNVRLPVLSTSGDGLSDSDANGSKPLENVWLSRKGFGAVLNGSLPNKDDLVSERDLLSRESRLGIALNNMTGVVKNGLLYQTQHVRPNRSLTVELDVSGLPESMPDKQLLRLGGEGRPASISFNQSTSQFPASPSLGNSEKIALYLLTPLPVNQNKKQEWQPLPGFIRKDENETQTLWTGILNGVELELHGAVTGKVHREGGWDMAQKKPRGVMSFIPAGSVFFCRVVSGDAKALHNAQVGTLTEYGYGHLAVGVWKDQ